MMEEVSARWNVRGKVHSPLDQSAFDKHKSRRAIMRLTEALGSWMEWHGAPRDVMWAWGLVKRQMADSAWVQVGETRLKWLKGLLSGWRLTALFGTLLNAAETLEALGAVANGTWWNAVFQGDDVRLVTEFVETSVKVAERMNAKGDDINLSKSFLSNTRDEFLRKVWRYNVISGYPARAINSLLWRNPIVREPVKGMLRFEDLSEGWSVLWGRLESWGFLNKEAVLQLWVSDLVGANSLDTESVLALLHTPRSLGGLGAFPYTGGRLLRYSVGSRKPKAHWSRLYPGIASGAVRWKRLGVEGEWLEREVGLYWLDSVEMPSGVSFEISHGELENTQMPTLRRAGYNFKLVQDEPRISWLESVPLAARGAVLARTKVRGWSAFLKPESAALVNMLSTRGWRKSVLMDLVLGRLGGSNPRMVGLDSAFVSYHAKRVWRLGWGYALTHAMDLERWRWLSWRMEDLVRLEVRLSMRTGVRFYT
uniref:RdRp n=1 Tax=viral metagenome TaxID=1070528 RepID=A0A2V0R9M6_9ZZZZ